MIDERPDGSQRTRRRNGAADQTRAQLLDAAESLFAEHGVEAVSLRAIGLAGGQRNNGAVFYHFGDKRGLIDALVEDRMERIERARARALADIEDADALDAAALLRLLWQPVLDLGRVKSVHWFTQVQLRSATVSPAATYPDAFPVSRRLHAILEARHPALPPALFRYRLNLVAMMFWSAVSWHDHATRSANQNWSSRFDLDEVVRVSCAALTAPPALPM